jgi:hypothetical protein
MRQLIMSRTTETLTLKTDITLRFVSPALGSRHELGSATHLGDGPFQSVSKVEAVPGVVAAQQFSVQRPLGVSDQRLLRADRRRPQFGRLAESLADLHEAPEARAQRGSQRQAPWQKRE